MKKIERQNINFRKMINDTSKEGVEYVDFVKRQYINYKEELKNRSIFMKIIVFILGDYNMLAESLIKDYGKHNLDTLI